MAVRGGSPAVGAAAAGTIPVAASAGTAATPVGVLLRWLALCALAGLVGCLAVAGPVLGRARAASASDTVAVGAQDLRGLVVEGPGAHDGTIPITTYSVAEAGRS